GHHIAAITSPDGQQTFVSVWNTDDLTAKPVVLGLGAESVREVQQRFMAVSFVKNDRIALTVRQIVDRDAYPRHGFPFLLTDVDGKGKWQTSLGKEDQDAVSPAILSRLPRDLKNILVRTGGGSIYKVDIYAGSNELVSRGSEKFDGYQVDLKGEVRAKQT